ncbi:MAG: ATP-binding protein [Planctomycetota bacterium]|nr:ATP-binding protein [Planctomycetota bacterium]
MSEQFTSQITVDKNIVSLLSRFTYERSFPYALREVVSNAYDADATTARIAIDLKKEEALIIDDGNGMTKEEFDFYLRIAGQKRGKRETPKFGRKRIGQFGVGFLAILPFCETLQILSTAENSEEIFTANIPASKFFKQDGKAIDVGEITVPGKIERNPRLKSDHYTQIRLLNITDLAKRYFHQKPLTDKKDWIASRPAMERLKWEMQEDLPLAFPDGSKLNEILTYPESVGMEVYLQDDRLFRNCCEGELIDTGESTVEGIRFRYAIITPWKAVRPYELRGLKLRLNNVGVGSRTVFEADRTHKFSRMQWLSGEVQVLSGLDTAITLSRDAFVSVPEYEAMSSKLVAIISKWAYYLEDVDVASRDMTKHLRGGKQVTVASKKEIVEKNIKTLQDRGFTVRRVDKKVEGSAQPVYIDKKKKEVVVYSEHPGLEDTISIGGKKHRIFYIPTSPGKTSYEEACRIKDNGDLEINTKYPLFKSKRYGDLFKKIYVIAVLARRECSSAEDMYKFILSHIDKEFSNF